MSADEADLLHTVGARLGDARADLVRNLLARGCTAEEIRQAHEHGRLALLPLEHAVREEGTKTLEQIAAEHEVEVDALIATRHALGLRAEPGKRIYGHALSEHTERLRAALESGVPLEALIEINRVIARSLTPIAAASRDALQSLLADRAEGERALAAAQAAEALAPELERLLGYAYSEYVRELVRHAASDELLKAGEGADEREVSVAFADLVGYTRLGDELSPAQLGKVAAHLEELTHDALQPEVDMIKTIGDEVMLASADPSALVTTTLKLLQAAEHDSEAGHMPPLRAGAAHGAALQRNGDFYGATVNLASRLSASAEPGTLVVTERLRELVPDGRWTSGGAQAIRGFEQPVLTYLIRPPSAG